MVAFGRSSHISGWRNNKLNGNSVRDTDKPITDTQTNILAATTLTFQILFWS